MVAGVHAGAHVTAHGATSALGCKHCLFSRQIGGEVVYRSDEAADTAGASRAAPSRHNQSMKGLVFRTIYIQPCGTS